jgi:hypothetical protein
MRSLNRAFIMAAETGRRSIPLFHQGTDCDKKLMIEGLLILHSNVLDHDPVTEVKIYLSRSVPGLASCAANVCRHGLCGGDVGEFVNN